MGLDMYLNEYVYIGGEYDFNNIAGDINITQNGIKIELPLNKIVYVVLTGAYWRKANQIHRWFVVNCQNGEDECQLTRVSPEKLQTLLDTCERVKENPKLAPIELPTESGFFFGSTEYDMFYWEDVNYTIEVLTKLLNKDTSRSEFYYQASW